MKRKWKRNLFGGKNEAFCKSYHERGKKSSFYCMTSFLGNTEHSQLHFGETFKMSLLFCRANAMETQLMIPSHLGWAVLGRIPLFGQIRTWFAWPLRSFLPQHGNPSVLLMMLDKVQELSFVRSHSGSASFMPPLSWRWGVLNPW